MPADGCGIVEPEANRRLVLVRALVGTITTFATPNVRGAGRWLGRDHVNLRSHRQTRDHAAVEMTFARVCEWVRCSDRCHPLGQGVRTG